MRALTDISRSPEYHRVELDLNSFPHRSYPTFSHQLKRLAKRVWTHLTWGRWTAIGLFLAAFVTAQWLKHHW